MKIPINANLKRKLIAAALAALAASAAFGLGRLSVLLSEKEPIAIEGYQPEEASSSSRAPIEMAAPSAAQTGPPSNFSQSQSSISSSTSESALFVASKTGKSYYFPWCGIVKRIKPANLVSFHSKTEAEKAGYKPGNCAGLNK